MQSCKTPEGNETSGSNGTQRTDMPRNIVVIDEASIGYDGRAVLTGVNITVQAGQAVALLGSNGSGKSTIIGAIAGFVKTYSGRLSVNAQRIAYMPQSSGLDSAFPITAAQVVELGLAKPAAWYQRKLRSQQESQVRKALEQVGLADKIHQRFGELSGGQQQRVLLARCLVAHPQLMLLDEPFNGLDAISRSILLSTLRQLKAQGVAIITSTHDLRLVDEVCDQVVLLDAERANVMSGSIGEIYQTQAFQALYGVAGVHEHEVNHGR